jgi:hypothetical protein
MLTVKSFGITGSLLAINFIAFWGVVQRNVVGHRNGVVEYVTGAPFNSEMYFCLCVFSLWLQ